MIHVDPRVGSGDMLTAIKGRVNGAAKLAPMDAADFAFEGHGPEGRSMDIGIERKAIGDMLGSMRSGRYAGAQAIRMSETFDICYLIVEGLWRPNQNGILETYRGGWKPLTLAAKGPMSRQYFMYAELDKFLATLEILKNVVVVRSTSKMETVWQVVNRYLWWQKEYEDHNSADPLKLQADVAFIRASTLRLMAAQMPGIGWARSKAVAKHFRSIERMATALSSEWRDIDGIGEKLAVKCYAECRKEEDQ